MSVTPSSAFDNPQGAILRLNGALQQFRTAVGSQTLSNGFITDELTDLTGAKQADRRVISPGQDAGYPYAALSSARLNSLVTIAALHRYQPTLRARIGQLFAHLGYIEVLFAENMCSGVPTGAISGEQPAYGPTLSRSQMLQLALTYFDSAARYGLDSAAIRVLASAGRARVLVDSGDVQGAAVSGDSVPTGFLYQLNYASPEQNPMSTPGAISSIASDEGINGLPFVTAQDPRVPIVDLGAGAPGGEVFWDANFSSASSPLTLGSSVETQLIQAEAALSANDVASWAAILNGLRQTAISPAMDTLPSDSTVGATATARVDVLFRERAFWLFGTGHRQGDLRRLVRQYGRPVSTVFPTGPYHGGPSQYGNDVTFTPVGEDLNPNFHGCFDRAP